MARRRRGDNLGRVEVVPADGSLGKDAAEVVAYRGERVGLEGETLELRVIAVALGESLQNFLCEKSFAPKSDETGGVEVRRVKRPHAHSPIIREVGGPTFSAPVPRVI